MNQSNDLPLACSASSAARMLDVSMPTFDKFYRDTLPKVVVGRRVKYPTAAIRELVEKQSSPKSK